MKITVGIQGPDGQMRVVSEETVQLTYNSEAPAEQNTFIFQPDTTLPAGPVVVASEKFIKVL